MKNYIVLLCFLLFHCSSPAQQDTKIIQQIAAELKDGKTTISHVLSEKKYMSLHAETAFRDMIKHYAKAEKVTMITDDEPGIKITVKATVKTRTGEPLKDALVYMYQTSGKGWYAGDAPHVGGNEGDMRHARLFVYLKTNARGEFELVTVKPKGYPNSDLPAHIHIMMWQNDKPVSGVPGELLFDDDERLTSERKERAIRDGFLISKNSGTHNDPVYQFTITVAGN